jgi:glycosyltransferase involved in cell wall biosynthesis
VKVCILAATYLPHKEFGAERAVRLLAGALADRGHEPHVVTTCGSKQPHAGRVDNHPVTYLPQHNFYWSGDRDNKGFAAKVAWHARDSYNPAMGRAVGHVLDELRPDVVHTNILAGFSVAAWQAAHARRIPIVHTLHDYYLLCPKSNMFAGDEVCRSQCLACRMFAIPRTAATRLVAAVTAPSHAVLQPHLDRGLFGSAQVREVVQYVCPGPAEEPRDRPGVGPPVLGFIGRLTADKGVTRLLDWMAGPASKEVPGLRLVVAGTGPLEQMVQAAAARDGRIEYAGYTSPADFFPRITALAVPSIWNDPSPVVIREAYGYGIPVAGSRFGGIPELIRLVDERLVFDTHDPRDMTRAIELALGPGERPALATACRQATEQFTAERVCEQMESVYRTVASK